MALDWKKSKAYQNIRSNQSNVKVRDTKTANQPKISNDFRDSSAYQNVKKVPIKPDITIPSLNKDEVKIATRNWEALSKLERKGIKEKIDIANTYGINVPEEIRNVIKPKTGIFSGGAMRDFFDAMGIPIYGVAGFFKGTAGSGKKLKGQYVGNPLGALGAILKEGVKNIPKGIKERASFMDEELYGGMADKAKTPLGKAIYKTVGFASDIALDPSNALFGILGKVAGVGKDALAIAGSKLLKSKITPKILEKIINEGMNVIGKNFIYLYGVPEKAKAALKNITREKNLQKAEQIGKAESALKEFNLAERKRIGQVMKGGLTNNAKVQEATNQLRDIFKTVGKQLVDEGLLDADTYISNINKYFPRLYSKFELEDLSKIKTTFKKSKFDVKAKELMKRNDIPEEVRLAMGEIFDAKYPTLEAIDSLNNSIANAKFFNYIAKNYAKSADEIAGLGLKGWKQLPESSRFKTSLAKLQGKYVPEGLHNLLVDITKQEGNWAKNARKTTQAFKYGKVILSPPTHIRNVLSNILLNDITGVPFYRADVYVQGLYSLSKGKGNKFFDEAYKVSGAFADSDFVANELTTLARKGLEESSSFAGKTLEETKKMIDSAAKLYQKEEQAAKMSAFIYFRKAGKDAKEAWELAKSATFDYSEVTPFIRNLRNSVVGVPFITFTYKATPKIIKTALTAPKKLNKFPKLERYFEEQFADMPDSERKKVKSILNMQFEDNRYLTLPFKDKNGRQAYLDMAYFYPLGDLLSGRYFKSLAEGDPSVLSPFAQAVIALSKNEDYFGRPIFSEGDTSSTKIRDMGNYLYTLFAPSMSPPIPGITNTKLQDRIQNVKGGNSGIQNIPKPLRGGGYIAQQIMKTAYREPDYLGRRLPAWASLAGIFGLKIKMINPKEEEFYASKDASKKLEKQLTNYGALKQSVRETKTQKYNRIKKIKENNAIQENK